MGAAEDINRVKRINRISWGLKIPYPLNKRSNSKGSLRKDDDRCSSYSYSGKSELLGLPYLVKGRQKMRIIRRRFLRKSVYYLVGGEILLERALTGNRRYWAVSGICFCSGSSNSDSFVFIGKKH